MKPDLAADVGNTRIKWGWCQERGVAACPPLVAGDRHIWREQIEKELIAGKEPFKRPLLWAVGGVQPRAAIN